MQMKRCFMPPDFGKVSECSIHHFSDACESGYGQASYLRLVDKKVKIHCSLVMGKSRVAPLTCIYKYHQIGTSCCNTVSEDFSNVEERVSIPRPQRDVLD